MAGLKFKNDPSPSLPDKPLSDASVGVNLVGGSVTYDGSTDLKGVKFGVDLEGNASVSAFNSPDDKDVDGVLGSSDGVDDQLSLTPQIEFNDEHAWTKYRVSAKVKASIAGDFSPVAFKIDASETAVFTDYHVHAPGENTRAAVKSDIGNLRFAGNPADIAKLSAQEALSYQVRGELSASITLSWSDVITASIGAVSALLPPGQLLTLKITPSASVTFSAGVVDDFKVVFSRQTASTIRVAIKKSEARTVGVGVGLGVKVAFADPETIEQALAGVVNSVIGEPVNAIDEIFKKASLDQLTSQQKKIVEALIKRLGLENVADSIAELREKWEAFKEKINGTIKQVATAKVELAFTYEYLRVRTDESLLVADLDTTTLEKFHNDLMICRITGLLEWIKANPQSLIEYLHQTSLTRTQAWGFTLGIGSLTVGGKDTKEITRVVQSNLAKDERIAFKGARGYKGTWVHDKSRWIVDFKADMDEFVKQGTANVCQFKYGLHFKWLWEENKLTKSELQNFLDYAVIWRILTQDNVAEVVASLAPHLNKKATVSVELTIDDAALRKLLPGAAEQSDGSLPASALAKALPYMSDYEGRKTAFNREHLYAGLWDFYFRNSSLDINAFPATAGKQIKKVTQEKQIKDENLSTRERGPSGSLKAYQDPSMFSGQIYLHGNTVSGDYSAIHDNWLKFAQGLKDFNRSIETCAPSTEIERIFKLLSHFWGQTLYVRAAGIFLVDVAARQNSLQLINRVMTINPEGADAIVITAAM